MRDSCSAFSVQRSASLISLLFAFAILFPFVSFAADPAPADTTQTQSRPTPSDAAYQFQRQGIFDCNLNGAYAMSVGAMAATGGVYVPVADATTELNTGILVYKECVLREVVDRESESAGAGIGKKMIVAMQTGRNGQPLYVVNRTRERVANANAVVVATFNSPAFNALNPSMQDQVKRYVLRKYAAPPQNMLGCSFQGDVKAFQAGTLPFNFGDFFAGMQPQCDPLMAGYYAESYMNNLIALSDADLQAQWQAGRDIYPVTDNNPDPLARNIVTPAAAVQLSFQAVLDSPVHRLEQANDIGQMINALYAGMATQIVSDSRGLTGLTQGLGGQASYLDQLVTESNAGLRNAAANAALNILNASRQVEAGYLQAMNGIANTLSQTIGQLRSAENQCWNLIVQKVCTGPVRSDKTCDAAAGGTLKVATSTMFSQRLVDAQIVPLATTTLQNIAVSQRALGLLDNLVAGVAGTSLDAQRLALQQLDALVAQRALHTPQDLTNASQQLTSVQNSMSQLVQDTVKSWADEVPTGQPFSSSNQVGWCNVNQQSVVDYWSQKWKQ